MKIVYTLIFGILILFLNTGCEPECTERTYSLDSPYKEPNQELRISVDPGSLAGSLDIIFSQDGNEFRTKAFLDEGNLEYRTNVPDIFNGLVHILVDDSDCGYITLSNGVEVQDYSFFARNVNFLIPAPLTFIVPTIQVPPPVIASNGWVSYDNIDYCIWFAFYDTLGKEIPMGNDSMKFESKYINPNIAQELHTGLFISEMGVTDKCKPSGNPLIHRNPVSGILDKKNNVISILIDRTSKGLGIEHLTGKFIDPNTLGIDQQSRHCVYDGSKSKSYAMLLTSETTGRQLVLFQLQK
ncbi:MAG: hypothetical protein KDC57_01100 [Saprospiraceae bacterium]|nr:hypothetical protein [Saprospiraceae bacterium]